MKIFQECFIAKVHTVYLLKPDGFWESRRASFGSSKLIFEVSNILVFIYVRIPYNLPSYVKGLRSFNSHSNYMYVPSGFPSL